MKTSNFHSWSKLCYICQWILRRNRVVINKDTQLITAALSGPNTVVIKKSSLSSCMPEASLESLIPYDCAVGFKFRGISWIFFASNCILRVNCAVELSLAVHTAYCCTLDTYISNICWSWFMSSLSPRKSRIHKELFFLNYWDTVTCVCFHVYW
jgi:hypothetical protein